jgi:4-hydroxythreonine-4-phosphate dehydrogenase
MGDPAGIGAEVILKALFDDAMWKDAKPLVYGDLERLLTLIDRFSWPIEVVPVDSPADVIGRYPRLEVVDFSNAGPDFPFGAPSVKSGRASLDYIRPAAIAAMEGRVAAIVTAPISKDAIRIAGSTFSGHTDMLAAITRARRHAMTLVAGNLRAIFVTAHIALSQVPSEITRPRVLDTIELAAEALKLLGEDGRPIAVTGINPHSGEMGIFGSEEMEKVVPAIEEAQGQGINCVGPVAGDIVFHRMYIGEFAIVVTMYHDLGHAPLKMVAFDEGVNWTVGLPIIRTSPDHGTAWEIAGTGKARPDSFKAAYRFALNLVKRKQALA